MSNEHKLYLKKLNRTSILIRLIQISIFIVFITTWELLSHYKIINPFIFSSPSKIVITLINLHNQNNLYNHIFVTVFETCLSFILAALIGLFVASIMWWNKIIAKVIDPYLVMLNSLPKVALGPIIIIWVGANMNSIILMSLLISVIITINSLYHSFIKTDLNKYKLLKSLGATKWQIYTKLIIPSNIASIINTLKINISMSLIGVIMGEFLVSKEGIGYLIMYGSQVFNLSLVLTGIFLLGFISYLLYQIINLIDKYLNKKNHIKL